MQAVIYRPSGPSAQYGYDQKGMNGGTKLPYKIWLPTQETWENPLMGWASSSDVASSSFAKMSFGTVEQAADFLRKVGMEWTVDEKPANFGHSYRPQRYQGYGDNFRCALLGGTVDVQGPLVAALFAAVLAESTHCNAAHCNALMQAADTLRVTAVCTLSPRKRVPIHPASGMGLQTAVPLTCLVQCSTKRGGLPDLSHLPSMRKKAAAPKKTGATE